MGTQLPLDFFQQRGKLERAFWDFHFQHPEVYEHLLRFAHEWQSRRGDGARLGIAMLFERVRWELHLQLGDDIPKLNNNHRAFYARLLRSGIPIWKGCSAFASSGSDLLRSRQRASAQKQACAMTFEERLKFYQELNADKFAEWMMNQHLPAAKLLNREVLAVCWNRGVEASMGTEEQWRPVLALWYACGMVQGLLSAIDAMYECQELKDVQLLLEALMALFSRRH